MLHRFELPVDGIPLPSLFTWPFAYTPHPLSRMAAEQTQRYIASRDDWREELDRGKMFGVLTVRDTDGTLGFLAAFSGNLDGTNRHDYFVPPVYDMLRPDDFFRREEAEISIINRRVAELEQSDGYVAAREGLAKAKCDAECGIEAMKRSMQLSKQSRAARRAAGADEAALVLESQRENADFQRLKHHHKQLVELARTRLAEYDRAIEELRAERRRRSADLQMRIFSRFRMLNARDEERDLCNLFAPTPQRIPPAGAGECAAPKLLQYAYRHGMQPLAMAEFWWGRSPKGEVRRHGNYYPACNGKCKPILLHMLEGLEVEPNPLLGIEPPEPRIVWEDDHAVAIDKPSGMLSVTGKSGVRSVEEWARERYPDIAGPVIVHRLDQSTSGLLLLAKSKEAHKALQAQFINHTVKKSYVALLDGTVEPQSGTISLPLKLDYDHRPRQMVAPDGRSAVTRYEVIGHEGAMTRVRFHPLTGRTHQLRVHAAHADGLDAPIVGDDIYGTGGGRLCLHAETIEFDHPADGRRIRLHSPAEF